MCVFNESRAEAASLPLHQAPERHGLITSGKLLRQREATSLSLMVYHRHLSAQPASSKKWGGGSQTFDSFASLQNVQLRGSEALGNRFHFDFTAQLAQIYRCIYSGVDTLQLLSFFPSSSVFFSFFTASAPEKCSPAAAGASLGCEWWKRLTFNPAGFISGRV